MKKVIVLIIFTVCIVNLSFPQIRVIDEKSVSVTVQGWGKKVSDTKTYAFKRGVELVALDMMSAKDEIANYENRKNEILENADKYIVMPYRITQKLKQKGKRQGKKYALIMTLELTIHKERLRNDLVDKGFIASTKELRRQLDNFSLMPYVDERKSSREITQKKDTVYNRIASYLQNQGIPIIGEEEIKNVEETQEVIALTQSSSADIGEEDVMLQIARNTNADFYVKVVGHVEEVSVEGTSCFKVDVAVSVYAVMTGEHIASQTGYSPAYSLSSRSTSVSAGIEVALDSTMHSIIKNLRRFWKDYVKDGKPYKLLFYDYSFGEIAKIRRVLKEMEKVGRIKLDKRVGNLTSFITWYNGTVEDLLFDVPGRIELNLKKDPEKIGNNVYFFRKKD